MHAQNIVNSHILRMLEGTVSLDATHIALETGTEKALIRRCEISNETCIYGVRV